NADLGPGPPDGAGKLQVSRLHHREFSNARSVRIKRDGRRLKAVDAPIWHGAAGVSVGDLRPGSESFSAGNRTAANRHGVTDSHRPGIHSLGLLALDVKLVQWHERPSGPGAAGQRSV